MNDNLNKIKHYLKRIKHYSGNWRSLIKFIFFVLGRTKNVFHPTSNKQKEEIYEKLVKGKKEIVKEILGNEMILPVDDKGLSKDLIVYGKREFEVLKLLKRLEEEGCPLVDKNSKVIEIGANIGYYALMWARIIDKGNGFLYAIEPNPFCFKYLKKNMKLNNFKRVKLMNLGISDTKSDLIFRLANEWNTTKVVPIKEKKPEDIFIPSNCLDSLFKDEKNVNLIRMDIEGYEYQTLKGAENFLRNNKNLKIFMEFHAHILTTSQKKEIVEILKKAGFKLKYYIDSKGKIRKGGNLNILKTFIRAPHLLLVRENVH